MRQLLKSFLCYIINGECEVCFKNRVKHTFENGQLLGCMTITLLYMLKMHHQVTQSPETKTTLNMWGRSCSGCSLPGWLFSSVCIMSSGSTGSGGSGEWVTKSSSKSSSVSSDKSPGSDDLRDNRNPGAKVRKCTAKILTHVKDSHVKNGIQHIG